MYLCTEIEEILKKETTGKNKTVDVFVFLNKWFYGDGRSLGCGGPDFFRFCEQHVSLFFFISSNMKDIELSVAFDYLMLSEGIIHEGKTLTMSLIGLEDSPDNEFGYIAWSDDIQDEPVDFIIAFKEGDNETVRIDGSYMTLVNTDGEEEEIQLLAHWDIERHLTGD